MKHAELIRCDLCGREWRVAVGASPSRVRRHYWEAHGMWEMARFVIRPVLA